VALAEQATRKSTGGKFSKVFKPSNPAQAHLAKGITAVLAHNQVKKAAAAFASAGAEGLGGGRELLSKLRAKKLADMGPEERALAQAARVAAVEATRAMLAKRGAALAEATAATAAANEAAAPAEEEEEKKEVVVVAAEAAAAEEPVEPPAADVDAPAAKKLSPAPVRELERFVSWTEAPAELEDAVAALWGTLPKGGDGAVAWADCWARLLADDAVARALAGRGRGAAALLSRRNLNRAGDGAGNDGADRAVDDDDAEAGADERAVMAQGRAVVAAVQAKGRGGLDANGDDRIDGEEFRRLLQPAVVSAARAHVELQAYAPSPDLARVVDATWASLPQGNSGGAGGVERLTCWELLLANGDLAAALGNGDAIRGHA
jgi:hypothetical protein